MNIREIIEESLRELHSIRHPSKLKDDSSIDNINNQIKEIDNIENKKIYEILEEIDKNAIYELTTARNRNLINQQEQQLLRKTIVAFFGLSVGSHAAITWMMQSRADTIKIIDPDIIMPTNLNRLRFGWGSIGRTKIETVARYLKDINPYVSVITSQDVDPQSIERIFNNEPKIDYVVDEIDSLPGKILLRKLSKKYKIPLISATDVGDNIFIDVENYKASPDLKMFLGRVPNIDNIEFSKLTRQEMRKLVFQIVGFEHNSDRMLQSLKDIGKSIVTWPQLGSTATISGGVITTVLKKLIIGEMVKSGRYYLSLDEILVSDYNNYDNKLKRKELIESMINTK